jgi:hypothetical protein
MQRKLVYICCIQAIRRNSMYMLKIFKDTLSHTACAYFRSSSHGHSDQKFLKSSYRLITQLRKGSRSRRSIAESTKGAVRTDLEPDLEVEGGAAVPRGVEEAEGDAAVDPAAQQHGYPQRRPPCGRAPHEVLFGDPIHPGHAGR